jgi:hypothetical protein
MKTMRVQQQVIINAIVEHNLVQLALAHRLISVPTGRALG